MIYNLQKMSKEELNAFLDLFSISTLCNPIAKMPKHFQKFTSGFRTTNIPKPMLYKIYYDEIHSELDSPMKNFLINNCKLNFADTRIEELVDGTTPENLLKIASELEGEILHAKLTISPSQVYKLAGYDLLEEQVQIMESYHTMCISEMKSVKEETTAVTTKENDEKYEKLNGLYERVTKSLLAERNEVSTLNKIIKQKDTKINSKEKETALLQEKLQEALNKLLNHDKKISILEERTKLVGKLLEEANNMKDHCEKLEIDLVEAKKHELTPQMVHEMRKDVIEDLRSRGLSEEKLLADADSVFKADETIDISWTNLSAIESENILYILEKMNANEIGGNDIENLDLIENMVLYKYMIVKSLKTVFYKYLEQRLGERTIDQNF